MFIRHSVLRVVERDTPDHFAVIRITWYNRKLSGFGFGQRFFSEQYAESTFLAHATMATDTMFIKDRFYLGSEVDRLLISAATEENCCSDYARHYKQQFFFGLHGFYLPVH